MSFNSINKNILIINYPPDYPKSVHLYITNECNLDCARCYYRSSSDPVKQLSYKNLKDLFEEWKRFRLTSIAIGGGEPMLHPDIKKIVEMGIAMGFFMAVTTNGTILKPIKANRINISYDEIHPTWKNEKLIQKAIIFYKSLGCKVGLNHVVRSLEGIEYVNNVFDKVDNVLLIREKPESKFNDWVSVQHKRNYWIEGCIEGSRCEQGILSFHIDYEFNASICSNFEKKIKYTTLDETWNKLKHYECKIRDSNSPKIF